jgi:DNA-binding transcriptional LysR family regulator
MLTDVATMHAVCLAGYGIAHVLELGVDAHLSGGRFVALFPDWEEERFPLYAYSVAPIPSTEDAHIS